MYQILHRCYDFFTKKLARPGGRPAKMDQIWGRNDENQKEPRRNSVNYGVLNSSWRAICVKLWPIKFLVKMLKIWVLYSNLGLV